MVIRWKSIRQFGLNSYPNLENNPFFFSSIAESSSANLDWICSQNSDDIAEFLSKLEEQPFFFLLDR